MKFPSNIGAPGIELESRGKEPGMVTTELLCRKDVGTPGLMAIRTLLSSSSLGGLSSNVETKYFKLVHTKLELMCRSTYLTNTIGDKHYCIITFLV